ncbi:MAG: hypothetical protein A2W36_07040 [Chloroflexi bacterium RBG_16_58_14]|nr:MAG: hypothetical protein A2W36_07040 [Chloroflexi bacterium RBG_16_58_14]
MARKALFEGLVFDENGQAVGVTQVGDEPCYVVDDAGFKRHIPSEQVDRQVLDLMREMIQGQEGLLSEQAAKMLGQDDIFSKAMIENQLKHIDDQFAALFESGIPEEARAFIGMAGFRVKINLHGDVIDVEQPGMVEGDEGD